MPNSTLLHPYAVALYSVSQDISVFSVYGKDTVIQVKGKDEPRKKGSPACSWTTAYTTNPARVKSWFEAQDQANPALRPAVPCDQNNLFVIDIDLYKPDFSFGQYENLIPEWEKSCQVKQNTVSGGRHLFFKLTDELREFSIGQDLGNSKGIDWRGKGGYIILYDKLDFSKLTDVPDSLLKSMQEAPNSMQAHQASSKANSKSSSKKTNIKKFYESYDEAGLLFEAPIDAESILITCPKCSEDRKKSSQECLRIQIKKQEWMCFHCNWAGQISPKPIFKLNTDYFKKVLEKMGVQIRYNKRKQAAEYKISISSKELWKELSSSFFDKWYEWNSRIVARIRERISLSYFKYATVTQDTLKECKLSLDDFNMLFDSLLFISEVDPFLEYLLNLPIWDEIERLELLLETIFEVDLENINGELLKFASKYTFMVAVARAFSPGVKADHMTILHGPEGLTKSTFWKRLMPDEDNNHFYTDSFKFFLKDKALVEATLGKVIVDASEMAGANRIENETILAYITQEVDHIRLSYERNPINIPRSFVFVGTTNKEDSLPSSSEGTRRFMVVPIIDRKVSYDDLLRYLDEIRDQIWAEAMYLVREKQESFAMPSKIEKLNKRQAIKNTYILDQGAQDVLVDKKKDLITYSEEKEGLTMTEVFFLCQLESKGISGRTGKSVKNWLLNNRFKQYNNHKRAKGRRNWQYHPELDKFAQENPDTKIEGDL